MHFAWANSADGITDFSTSNSSGRSYIGVYSDNNATTSSQNPSDYTWTLIKGPKGDTGATGPQGETGPQGQPGAIGPTARWYYGTELNHTTGTAQLAVSETPGVVEGAMYLNPYLTYVYRCTTVGDTNATWEYVGDLSDAG